ncbi:hypothetical protein, partial [Thorsellia anophelis]
MITLHKNIFIIRPIILGLMALGFSYAASAVIATKQTEQKEIQGYPPYMQSVGAELLTEVKDSDT